MWAGTGLSLSAGSFAAALPSWRSVVGGLPLGLAAAIEEKRADDGEGSFPPKRLRSGGSAPELHPRHPRHPTVSHHG